MHLHGGAAADEPKPESSSTAVTWYAHGAADRPGRRSAANSESSFSSCWLASWAVPVLPQTGRARSRSPRNVPKRGARTAGARSEHP